jgi:pimeloyl-ACP methyl ester carboxylesterase
MLVLALVATMTSPVAAQEPTDADQGIDEQFLEDLGTTVDELTETDPNPAWDQLGLLSDDANRVVGAATRAVDGISYAFGDDRNTPPTINPAGTTPTGVGSLLVELPADWTPPTAGIGDGMAFAQTNSSQLSGGDAVVLMWAEMDSDYDFGNGLTINEGFPLTLPNQPVWNSTFAGDTWEGANLIPNAVFDGATLTLDVKRYEPPQNFPLVDLAGFYYRSGNVMAIAVDATALTVMTGAQPAAAIDAGANQTLLYTGDGDAIATQAPAVFDPITSILMRIYSHIAPQLFTTGFIFFTPGAFAIVFSVFILDTTLILLITPLVDGLDQTEREDLLDPAVQPDPQSTAPPPSVATPTTTTTPSSSSSFPLAILILILGALVFALGLLIWLKTRVSSTTSDPFVDEEEDDDDEPSDAPEEPIASTPPPVIPASTQKEPTGLRPVIFVPGIMASALQVQTSNGPQQVWPPTGYGFDIPQCFEVMQATDTSKVEISESATNGLLPFIHLGLLGHLETMGYTLKLTDEMPANCYVHAYNWMESCAVAGAKLVALIVRATAEHGEPPSIIAHSMGGLVTRSALLGGAPEVDKVVFCATPHYGAPMAYFALHPDIPYQFAPGMVGRWLNAAYANATSGHGSDILFQSNPGLAALQELIETAAHAVSGSPGFNEHLKKVSANATGVFELIPDDLYFEHVHPTWPLVTHEDKWYRGSSSYERRDYTPMGASETYFANDRTDIPALPPQFKAQVGAALAFKKSISVDLPPGGADKTIVVYGAKNETVCESVMTDDGDAGQRGNVTATLGGEQGGDGTVPKESGRGEELHGSGVVLQRDNSAEHFMMTETKTFHAVLSQYLEPGGR